MCDRKVTLWGRPPACRFEGSPTPRHIFLQSKSAILILRKYRICLRRWFPILYGARGTVTVSTTNHCTSITRCWQVGVLPHRVIFFGV